MTSCHLAVTASLLVALAAPLGAQVRRTTAPTGVMPVRTTAPGTATLDDTPPPPPPAAANARAIGSCMVEITWTAVPGASAYLVTQVVEGTFKRPKRDWPGTPAYAVLVRERHERSLRVPAPQSSDTLGHSGYMGREVTHAFGVAAVGANGAASRAVPAGQPVAGCDGPAELWWTHGFQYIASFAW